MTSGAFHAVFINDITVKVDRQRRDLGDIESLMDSLARLGQIQPIVVTRENILVVGERRFRAAQRLGWDRISAQYIDEIDDEETLKLIELEENVKRKDLTWQEHHNAIIEIYSIRKQQDPDITQEEVGRSIGMSRNAVSEHINLENAAKYNPEIKTRDTFFKARNEATRLTERWQSDMCIGRLSTLTHHTPIQSVNALQWIPSYTGSPFNVIHCDLPYGIGAHKHEGQNSALDVDYIDDEITYWTLFDCLHNNLDRVCAESAHMIFWFSAKAYCATWEKLNSFEGFRWEPYPLIWLRGEGDKANEGIAPDTARRPRRIYEMAFFGWRGDRKIIRTKANAFTAPTERQRHPHEKSEAALRHWFEMCVDGNTRLFDPTCGSGSALRAALSLGASSVLGLELNEEYAKDARIALGTNSGDLRYA